MLRTTDGPTETVNYRTDKQKSSQTTDRQKETNRQPNRKLEKRQKI